MAATSNPYRLARTVVPSAYRLSLEPDLERFTFAGRVEIDVEIAEAISELTLHAAELELGSATLSVDGTSYRSLEHRANETYETVTFVFDREIPAGAGVIEIDFDGTLNDKLRGFYRSTFGDEQGEHVIATTQLQHSDARRAFPCFDEPAMKATFELTVTVPRDLALFSNSPELSNVEQATAKRVVHFAPTMVMSSYLVAVVVGPFEATEAVDVDGVPLRVVVQPGQLHLGEFALEIGAFALRFFSSYFAIPYPGDKLDLIAIPDFAAGAMENLGCITFRSEALLIDPAEASLAELQRVARVVAHEIAHMWFGDLVTMEWWEGVWLNEAFATFMEILCVNAFRPQWDMWTMQAFDRLLGRDRDVAMQTDALHSTRPIELEVISPDDTQGMFDFLTYEKGGSVLRMLEQYLGADTYRDGIRHYLATHSYANTITTDLWDALEETSNQPAREIMNTFILQGGVPLVTFEGGTLSQSPFHNLPRPAKSAVGETWRVPILTRSLDGGPLEHTLLGADPVTLSGRAPVLVNAGGSGYFRTHYGRDERAALLSRLDDLSTLERAVLVHDGWALLFAGRVGVDDFFAVASSLGEQNEAATWGRVLDGLDFMDRVADAEQHVRLRERTLALFGPIYERLGWSSEGDKDPVTSELRAIAIDALGGLGGDEEIQAEAVRRFEADDLGGDLARTILRVVARQNRLGDYETFIERLRHAATPQEAQRYQLTGVGAFTDERVELDAAEKCFDEFRSSDGPLVLMRLLRNPVTGRAVWRYYTERFDDAKAIFPANLQVRPIWALPTFIADEEFANGVEEFLRAHLIAGESLEVNQMIERMRAGLVFAAAVREQL